MCPDNVGEAIYSALLHYDLIGSYISRDEPKHLVVSEAQWFLSLNV